MAEDERKRVVDIIYGNDIEGMGQYLQEGGDVDFIIIGQTPLCITKTAEMANFLLNNGADIRFRGAAGVTPLIAQASPGNPEVVELMLRRYPPNPTNPEDNITRDVNRYGNTALHICVFHGYEVSLQCAEILVAADPGLVNVRNNEGKTPLHFAYENKNVATKRIIELLRKTAAGLKVAPFVTKHVIRKAEKLRTLEEAWRGPNGNGNLGGNAYQALASKYPSGLKSRKSGKSKNGRSRKSKSRKSRKSKTRRS
jgi:hypothetical protein